MDDCFQTIKKASHVRPYAQVDNTRLSLNLPIALPYFIPFVFNTLQTLCLFIFCRPNSIDFTRILTKVTHVQRTKKHNI